MSKVASLSDSLSRRRAYVLDYGGYPDINLPEGHSPNVQRLLASVANDCNRGRAPFSTFLTMHFDFEANSKVCMMGAFALGLHAYANDLQSYWVRKDGSSQEAKPELHNDDLEARAETKGP